MGQTQDRTRSSSRVMPRFSRRALRRCVADQRIGHGFLALRRPGFHALAGDQMHRIHVAAHDAGGRRHVVGDDPVAALAQPLGLGMFDHVFGFGGKADHQRRPAAHRRCATRRQDVRVFRQRKLRRAARLLLDLLRGCRGPRASRRPPPRTPPRPPARPPRRPPASARALSTRTTRTPGGSAIVTGPGYQRHLGAGGGRRRGDGMALLARGAVGDIAHRVDGLVRGPRRDQHAPAGQRPVSRARQPRPPPRRFPAARPCGRCRPHRPPPSRPHSARRSRRRRR